MSKSKNPPRIPDFSTSLQDAVKWIKRGEVAVARTKLRSRSGSDIVFFDNRTEDFINAPLYTRYIKKESEWRVHFAFGKQIDLQKKVLRKTDLKGNLIDPKSVDWRIRNHRNGFIFQRHGIDAPKDVCVQALKAYEASNLDFGAVDVIYNENSGKAYVLEINTAPGLEGETVMSYVEAFKQNL